jgi:hypothetical protein
MTTSPLAPLRQAGVAAQPTTMPSPPRITALRSMPSAARFQGLVRVELGVSFFVLVMSLISSMGSR